MTVWRGALHGHRDHEMTGLTPKRSPSEFIEPDTGGASMDRKTPTEILEGEHRVIQKVVGAMAVVVEGLGVGTEPPVETLRSMVDFMRTFADKCLHGWDRMSTSD